MTQITTVVGHLRKARHPGVQSQGNITVNNTSDGILAELFQILKDDAVKVFHSLC